MWYTAKHAAEKRKKLSTIRKKRQTITIFCELGLERIVQDSGHHVVNSCQFPAIIEQLFTDCPVKRISMEIIFVRRCKKSKQNSVKIIHRNTALKSTFGILYAIIAIEHVLPCINIRWSDVENLPKNPANVNGKKTCMRAMLESFATTCHEAWLFFILDSKCWPSSPAVVGENGQVCYYKLFFLSC